MDRASLRTVHVQAKRFQRLRDPKTACRNGREGQDGRTRPTPTPQTVTNVSKARYTCISQKVSHFNINMVVCIKRKKPNWERSTKSAPAGYVILCNKNENPHRKVFSAIQIT